MLQKKICMLGSYGVGKTSLVSRYVHSIFSDKYQSTIGVRIDRKTVAVDGSPVNLLLWDLHGDDEFQRIRPTYLRGAAGYLLVVDGTRPESLDVALELHELAKQAVNELPFILLVNKSDLEDQWQIDRAQLSELSAAGWIVVHTSAKTGQHVDEAFQTLAQHILAIA